MLPVVFALLVAPLEVVYHADLEGRLAVPRCDGAPTNADTDFPALVAALHAVKEDATTRGMAAPIMLLGGDQIAPDLFSRGMLEDGDTGARAIAAAFSRAGYDAITLGNHELSAPPQQLDQFVLATSSAGVPVVMSNMKCDATVRSFCKQISREVIVERGGQRIAILGILSPRTIATIPKAQLRGIELAEPADTITESVSRLRREGAAAVIVMMQISGSGGLEEVLALQRGLPPHAAPDLILSSSLANIDGERQTLLIRQDGSPAVVGSSNGTRGATHVTITPPSAPSVQPHVEAIAVHARADRRDEQAAAILAPHHERFCARFGRALGKPEHTLPTTKLALLDYALNVMQRATRSEIAFINAGLVYGRAFPTSGPWTRAALRRAFPYPATIGTLTVHGSDLSALLEKGEASGRLRVLGAARPAPGKPFEINGRPIDKARGYRIATTSFVVEGGDGSFPNNELGAWRASPIADLRDLVEASMDRGATFDVPASQRLLTTALGDLTADWTNTSIQNTDGLGDAQLARAQQQSIKLDLVAVLQLDHPRHRWDSRLNAKYGYARTRPPMMPAAGQETLDLVQLSSLYSYRGLTKRRYAPSPYSRLMFETELTVPATRTFRHAELTHTAGGLFTLRPKIKVRAGAGYRTELFASGDSSDPIEAQVGGYRFVAEVGATLDPYPIAKLGRAPATLEANVDYFAISPFARTEQQLRASSKLSVPLVPLLFLTAGVDIFVVDRETAGRGASIDTTIGLKLHLDTTHQSF